MWAFLVFPNEVGGYDQHAVMIAGIFVTTDLPWLKVLLILEFLDHPDIASTHLRGLNSACRV